MEVMIRSYRKILFISLMGFSVGSAASSVPFGEHHSASFSGASFKMSFDTDENDDFEHWNNSGYRSGPTKHFKAELDMFEEEHEEEHEEESSHTHAHPNFHFPHGEFPFEDFPKHDFPGKHFPDKFKEYPYPWNDHDVSPVPVPAAVWLFGSGLIGLAGIARRND